jgi:hypothetical protein
MRRWVYCGIGINVVLFGGHTVASMNWAVLVN